MTGAAGAAPAASAVVDSGWPQRAALGGVGSRARRRRPGAALADMMADSESVTVTASGMLEGPGPQAEAYQCQWAVQATGLGQGQFARAALCRAAFAAAAAAPMIHALSGPGRTDGAAAGRALAAPAAVIFSTSRWLYWPVGHGPPESRFMAAGPRPLHCQAGA